MKRNEKKKTAQFDRTGMGFFLRRLAAAAEARRVFGRDRFFEALSQLESKYK